MQVESRKDICVCGCERQSHATYFANVPEFCLGCGKCWKFRLRKNQKIKLYPLLFLFCASYNYSYAIIRPYIGATVGQISPQKNIYPAFISGLSLGFAKHSIGPDITALYFSQETKARDLREGSISMLPVMFSLRIAPPLSKNLKLNFRAGASYVFVSRNLAPFAAWIESYPNYKVTEEIESGLGYHFGGGLEFRLSPHCSISAEVIQLYFSSTLTHKRVDRNLLKNNETSEKTNINLDSIIGLLGIKFYF